MGKGVGGGAGSVRVIDEKTVHLRLPASYLEPETLIIVLRNLLNPNAAERLPSFEQRRSRNRRSPRRAFDDAVAQRPEDTSDGAMAF